MQTVFLAYNTTCDANLTQKLCKMRSSYFDDGLHGVLYVWLGSSVHFLLDVDQHTNETNYIKQY